MEDDDITHQNGTSNPHGAAKAKAMEARGHAKEGTRFPAKLSRCPWEFCGSPCWPCGSIKRVITGVSRFPTSSENSVKEKKAHGGGRLWPQSQGFSVAPNPTSQTANSHLLVVFWAVGLGHQRKSFQPEDWF